MSCLKSSVQQCPMGAHQWMPRDGGLLYADDTVQFLLSAVLRHISDCIASGVNRQKDLVAISSQRDACLTEDRCRLSECDQD